MTQTQPPTRTPASIIAAMVGLSLVGLLVLVEALREDGGLPLGIVVAAFAAISVVGCQRGWIPTLVFSLFLGAGAVLIGLLVLTSDNFFVRVANQTSAMLYVLLGAGTIVALLAPRSSRDWFFLRR